MSRATVHIPIEHLEAVRASLEANRQDVSHGPDPGSEPGRLGEIDALLEQLSDGAGEAGRAVSGAYDVLWQAAYDTLCSAAEGFAADCNDLWTDRLTTADLRVALARLEGRLDLLDALRSQRADG